MPLAGNLFAGLPAPAGGEAFEALLRCGDVRIERIASSATPETVVYDQTQDEWVCLLRGEAVLRLGAETLTLTAGDWLFIPAHTPHQVLATSAEPTCLWLAVHIGAQCRVVGPPVGTASANSSPASTPSKR